MKVYLNGEILDESEARVSVFDRGVSFGDGIYEVLRAYHGRVFALEDHLERLRAGCSFLRLRVRTSEPYWRPLMETLLAENRLLDRDARIRITITRGQGLDLPPVASLATEALYTLPIDEARLEKRRVAGLRARIVSVQRPADASWYRVKSTSLLPAILAQIECAEAGVDEAIICNTLEQVCEATVSNIFLVRAGMLFTPPLEAPCLPGVTRRHVIELARQKDCGVEERTISVDSLFAADEIFTTASIGEIMPIVEIHGRKIGKGTPGPVASQLQTWWREYVAQSFVK